MNIFDFQELLVSPTCGTWYLINKTFHLTSKIIQDKNNLRTLSLKTLLRFHLVGKFCEISTRDHHSK